MVKPTKTKSELEALILKKARALGLSKMVKGVTVRALRSELSGANWILVSMNPTDENDHARQAALRQILPEIREQFDLEGLDWPPQGKRLGNVSSKEASRWPSKRATPRSSRTAMLACASNGTEATKLPAAAPTCDLRPHADEISHPIVLG